MSDKALIDAMAEAMATKEGFYVTEKQARQRGIKWPTIAQKCCNPGNIRAWQDAQGRWYPTTGGLGPDGRPRGYVDFVAWARQKFGNLPEAELRRRALEEGWRKLKRQIEIYLSGRHTEGRRPTPLEMFSKYAPANDGNNPIEYAQFVAGRLGIPVDQPFPINWGGSDG